MSRSEAREATSGMISGEVWYRRDGDTPGLAEPADSPRRRSSVSALSSEAAEAISWRIRVCVPQVLTIFCDRRMEKPKVLQQLVYRTRGLQPGLESTGRDSIRHRPTTPSRPREVLALHRRYVP